MCASTVHAHTFSAQLNYPDRGIPSKNTKDDDNFLNRGQGTGDTIKGQSN